MIDKYLTLKKLRDPKFYLETFTKIKGKVPGKLIPFILNEAQKDLFNTVRKSSRVIILKARQIGFCFHPDTLILKRDLTWVKISSLSVGDEIIAVDENVNGGSGSSRKMVTTIVENKCEIYERALRLTMSNGKELILTPGHRMLCKARGGVHTQWRKSKDMLPGDEIRSLTTTWGDNYSYEDGWIGGMLDGEGCLRTKLNAGSEVTISQVDGDVWNRVVDYFKKNNYSYRIEVDKRLPGKTSKFGCKPVNKMVLNRMDELFELFGRTRPSRFLKRKWWETKKLPNNGWVKIEKIELLPIQRMIDLQTSAKTYIAEGFVSHNSTAMTGYFYHNTILNPGTTTALIGYNSELTAELLDKVKTFYRSTPDDLKPTIHYNSKYEISFPRVDSKILVLPSTENVGRGYTLTNCLATELASWEKAEEKMTTLEASVPIGGRLVIESCVTEDTILFTDNGPCFMEDIHDWDNMPLGFSEGNRIKLDGHYGLQPTNIYYNSGVQKGFRVRTKHGYEVGMSSVHKLFVLRNGVLEFVKSKDLKIGDLSVIKYGQELWGDNDIVEWTPEPYGFNKKRIKQFNPKIITEDLAYLIGLILGDGSIYKNDKLRVRNVTVTNIDYDITNFLLNNNLGLNFIQGKGENFYHYRCTNKSFVEFLQDYIGFKNGATSRNKKIPKIVLTWKRKNVIAFLQGLFDADGCCRKDRGEVLFTSTSKQIIDVVRVLLLNFGIISRTYSYNKKPSKKVKVWSSGYQLEISRSHSNIFLDKIGFRIKRKQENRNVQKKCYSCLQEFIPGIGKILKKNMKVLGLKYSDVSGGMNKSFFSKSGNITYLTLGKILEKCDDKESDLYKNLKELYNKKYFYDEISQIIPIEENVYDFTVENGHTVTYSGVVGHQTPAGQGNLYHRMWMAEDNGYAKKEYGWWWGYKKNEVELIRKRMNNPRKFAQEYSLEFLASGRSVFDQMIIKKQRKNILNVGDAVIDEKTGDTYFVKEEDGLRIYKKPESDGLYVMGVDVSEGVEGGDYSVATIFNRKTGEEVAMFRGLLPPDILARKIDNWGRMYNNALMVVEINNHGLTTVTVLRQLIYPSLYFRQAKFETIGQGSSDKIGWKTTKMTRPLLIDDFAQAVRDNLLTIHSKELLNEMAVFIYNDNGDMQPQQGFNDDSIFSAGIALQGFKIMSPTVSTQINYENILPTSFAY